MKALKKAAALLLAVCLMVPMFSMVVFAADGRLMFSDPETKVGENVSVDLVVKSDGDTVGDVSVTMQYETSALEFVSGDGFEADGSGTLTYKGTGSGSELRSTVQFRALTTGETKLTVSNSTASVSSGDTLNLTTGSSTIKISAADDGTTSVEPTANNTAADTSAAEATDISVSVNGTEYKFSETFTSSDIPSGYYEATQTFEGEEHKFVANDAGVYLGYLVDGSGAGSFFLFDPEKSEFSPYVELSISDTTSIIPLTEPEDLKIPDGYQEVSLNLTGLEQQYSAWSNPETDRYYLLYALNTRSGEKGLYQYDTEDGTYQSYNLSADESEKPAGSVLSGSAGEFIAEHALVIFVLTAVIIFLLLILLIVFAVKLVHRNQELDDLYEEYDIPFEEEEPKPEKKSKKKSGKKNKSAEDPEDDEFEDEDFDDEPDDYDDYDYDSFDDAAETSYSSDDYQEASGDDDEYDEDDFDDEYDDEYDDDDFEDDYDEDPEDEQQTKDMKGQRKNKSKKDDYKIDFIDL